MLLPVGLFLVFSFSFQGTFSLSPPLPFVSFFLCVCTKSIQSCPTLCHLMDRSPPGTSVHGILQARILEWVAMTSSRGSSRPRDRTCVSCDSCTAGRFFTAEPREFLLHLIPFFLIRFTSFLAIYSAFIPAFVPV